jgi:hypothetical protein
MNDQYDNPDMVERTDKEMNNPDINSDPFTDNVQVDASLIHETPKEEKIDQEMPMGETIVHETPMDVTIAHETPMGETNRAQLSSWPMGWCLRWSKKSPRCLPPNIAPWRVSGNRAMMSLLKTFAKLCSTTAHSSTGWWVESKRVKQRPIKIWDCKVI